MSAYYYIDAEGKAEGPVLLEDMRSLIADGILTTDDDVKRDGESAWRPAKKFPELARSRAKMPGVHPALAPKPAAPSDNLLIVSILVLCFPILGPLAALSYGFKGRAGAALAMVLLSIVAFALYYALYLRFT